MFKVLTTTELQVLWDCMTSGLRRVYFTGGDVFQRGMLTDMTGLVWEAGKELNRRGVLA